MKRGPGGMSVEGAPSSGWIRTGEAQPARAKGSPERHRADRLWFEGARDDALAEAHRSYRARLEAVAYRVLGSHTDAEDVVQKIFLSMRGIRFEGRASLWTYLYRAAINGSVNALRTRRRREKAERRLLDHQRVAAPAPHMGVSPEAEVLEGELLAGVAQALLKVKPQHRRVLQLRLMHGLTNTEIAEREGLPMATVGTWLRRGREELRKGLRPILDEMGHHES